VVDPLVVVVVVLPVVVVLAVAEVSYQSQRHKRPINHRSDNAISL